MDSSSNSTFFQRAVALVVLVILGIVVYNYLITPDRRSVTDRVGDAVHALPQGVDKASEQLEDRTPGQKLGDSIKDTGQKLKDSTSPQ